MSGLGHRSLEMQEDELLECLEVTLKEEGEEVSVSSYFTKLFVEPGPWVSKASCLSSSLCSWQVSDSWFIA